MNKNLMNKSYLWLLTLPVLAACSGSAPVKEEKKVALEPVKECVFPGSEKAAPLWVCDAPVDGIEVQAVGSARKTAAGLDFMKQQAAASARVRLAQQMRVQVQNQIKQFAETTGAGDKETVDQVNSSVTSQLTNESIVGSKVYRSVEGPDGTIYVLVGIDPENAKKIAKAAIATSMNNDQAAWQKLKSDKAQTDLAEAIAATKK